MYEELEKTHEIQIIVINSLYVKWMNAVILNYKYFCVINDPPYKSPWLVTLNDFILLDLDVFDM